MKVSLKWLKEYVHLPPSITVQEIADKLTFAGLEVEAIDSKAKGLEKVFVGEILEIKPHPNADRLQLTKISVGDALGTGLILSIVCGAKNIAVGQKIPVATIGAHLPNGIEIKESKIRGELSQGMLCSAEELKLTDAGNSQGIFILKPEATLGEPFALHMGFDDAIFEINITPNRGDALSHIGVARDLAAIFSLPIQQKEIALESGESAISVELKNDVGEDCKSYFARTIMGVKVGESPTWLKQKIENLGLRSVNNIVDATTFVMLEMGQPIHAFDADTIMESGKISICISNGKDKENFSTISHKQISLSEKDLVIRAGNEGHIPAALAGVMGSDATEVSEKTKNILLESAEFSAERVRKTNRSHGLLTDAAYRFERGIDPAKTLWALDRVASLIIEMAGGSLGNLVYTPGSMERKNLISPTIRLDNSAIENCLGISTGIERAKKILESLGCKVATEENQTLQVIPPSWRGDIRRKEDLIEEIARIWGYEHIQSTLPAGIIPCEQDSFPKENQKNKIRSWLTGNGFFEAINYGFTSKEAEKHFLGDADGKITENMIPIEGAQGKEVESLKTTLIPGLLKNIQHNLFHRKEDLRFFELRTVFRKQVHGKKEVQKKLDTGLTEVELLSIAVTGSERDYDWSSGKEKFDFYSLKGALESIFDLLGKKGIQWDSNSLEVFVHPKQSANLMIGNKSIGYCGRLHPILEKKMGAQNPIWIAEIELEKILSARANQEYSYKPYSKFPLVERDFSILVESSVNAKKIHDVVKQIAAPLFQDFMIFDVYKGERVPAGYISYAFRVWLGSNEYTLADKEIIEMHTKIMNALELHFSARFAGL